MKEFDQSYHAAPNCISFGITQLLGENIIDGRYYCHPPRIQDLEKYFNRTTSDSADAVVVVGRVHGDLLAVHMAVRCRELGSNMYRHRSGIGQPITEVPLEAIKADGTRTAVGQLKNGKIVNINEPEQLVFLKKKK